MEATAATPQRSTLQQQREAWMQYEADLAGREGVEAISDARYLRAKIYFVNKLEVKFSPPGTQSDEQQLGLLRADRARAEKMLYGNRVERALQRLLRRLVELPRLRKEQERKRDDQLNHLRQALRRTGLAATVEQMQLDFSANVDQMKANTSYRTAPQQRMDLELSFKRDKDGMMQFPYYSATLKDLDNPASDRKYTFRVDKQYSFDVTEAYNLLSGRGVKRKYINAEGKQTQEWVQLNFKEKAADGQYMLDRFPQKYGYSLDTALPDGIKFSELFGEDEKRLLISGLEKGNREQITVSAEGKDYIFYMETNPAEKKMNFYDHHQQPIKERPLEHIRKSATKPTTRIRLRGPRERMPEGSTQSLKAKR